ncbi:DUF3035 domain-containing protein [Chachezhania sediminis]|uniref:DUF3035 domain-containing protein n=1 Tax=Chachezhania sediminis TaxID=2599291 RepID=UPI00131DEC0D|nr:DUF3035 domain-containing protein [Chachezhania sediminis]
MKVRTAVLALIALSVVAGCSGKNGLRQLRAPGRGPDEFMVMPAKPLTEPKSYSELPPPTPGGANRTDRDPEAEAILALGGKPQAATAVPSSDSQLVAQAGRYGIDSSSRQSLEVEDEKFRKRKARASSFKLFPVDRYSQAYKRQAIDPFKENDRWRRAGVPTVTAPPEKLN